MGLERELATYQANLMELLANEGKFVVIRGDEIAGTWGTYEEALEQGYRKYGLEPFLVRKIQRVRANPLLLARPSAMPVLTGIIGPQGMMIEVKVMQSPQRVAALKTAGLSFSSPMVIIAEIDTGASLTCLDRIVISTLQLDLRNVIPIHTPSTGPAYENRNTYDATIVLGEMQPDPLVMTVEVIESEFASEGFLGLIGRDILSRCVLTYDGPSSQFRLSW